MILSYGTTPMGNHSFSHHIFFPGLILTCFLLAARSTVLKGKFVILDNEFHLTIIPPHQQIVMTTLKVIVIGFPLFGSFEKRTMSIRFHELF